MQYLKFERQQRDKNPQPLSSQTNTQPFSQTGQIIELCCEYFICAVNLTVFNYHVPDAFQSESSCLSESSSSESSESSWMSESSCLE